MRIEQVTIPVLRSVVNRPWLSELLFRFDPWGNPLGPERYSYPYPIYDRMRSDGPVSYRALYQQAFVIGHEEAKEVLASPDVIVSPQREVTLAIRPHRNLGADARSFIDHLLLFIDPPDHTRLRRLVSRAFSPRQVSRIEQAVESLAERLVGEMLERSGPDRRPVNVFEHFAGPLPVNVICELLGIPEERWEWAEHISETISLIGNVFVGFDPDVCSEAVSDLRRYILDLAAERRVEPRDDLITELALVSEDDDRLNDDELVGMVGILLFAGHETTSGLLGNSILALFQHPEQRELVRNQPDLWSNAVEELLRWDTPLQIDPRTAAEDLLIGGVPIKKGRNIVVMLGAANRDPDFYDDPNTLRLDRHDPQPVSFGHGMHHCLGHALARMETKVALRAFVEAFGDYTVHTESILWKESIVTRGPIRMLVTPGDPPG